ncbi:hypothetical protein L1987_88578 [Smallanthus sonchifolius]|nr:hypothetical protein L1987_88578 [Smallanthus sonchifolius]
MEPLESRLKWVKTTDFGNGTRTNFSYSGFLLSVAKSRSLLSIIRKLCNGYLKTFSKVSSKAKKLETLLRAQLIVEAVALDREQDAYRGIGIINSTSAVPGAAERDALAVEAKKGIEAEIVLCLSWKYPPVVPQVVSVPISTTHNPVLIPTSSTSTMNEHLSLDTVDQSLYSRIHNSEDGSTFGSCSGSQLLALRALQSTDILSKMQLCYRFFPDHTSFINCTFQVTKKMKKRLKQICKSIGFFSSSIPFYVPEVFQYSNLGQGLEDIAPPMEHFPRFESYHSFFNPETNKELLSKACYIERTDISGENVSILHSRYRTVIFDRISVVEIEDMIEEIQSAFCGLLRYYPNKKAGYLTLVRPSTERDVLLIAALEQVLLENTVIWKCPSIENLVYDFHSDISIKKWSVWNRIYRLEIDYPPDIGVAFTRFVSQVIIGTKDSDEVVFNEEAGYALLKSLGLTGQIVSIGLGDGPIPICGNKLVYIDNRL